MKRSLLFIICFISGFSILRAQVTSISVETFYTDNGTITGYPAGHTTYRIYANTTAATDRVVTIFGDDDSPLVLNVTGSGVWNHPAGGVVGNAVNCGLYGVLPASEYDSYLTVDYTCNSGSTNTIYAIEDPAQPWLSQVWNTVPYGAGNTLLNTSFGGAWFALTTDNNNVAGADLKVLIGQVTTDGNICGIFNLQVFPDYQGTGSPYIEQLGLQFGTVDCGLPGCTDNTALNFNPAAGINNGLCLYACGISIDADASAPTCAGLTDGSITFEGVGGQDLIEYSFDNVVAGLSAPTYSNLGNGTYTVQIHDTRFDNELMNPGGIYGTCTVTEDIVFNTTPLQLSGNTVTNVTCSGANDGCITVATFGGGTGAISYALMNADNSPVIGGGNPVVTSEPSYCGLGPGTYYFMATDENSCSLQGANFTVTSPAPLALVEGTEVAALCFNSSDATQIITWTGGTGDVDFSLEDDGVYDIEGNLSNAVLTGLAPGSYMIYASDINGCEAMLAFDVAGGPAIVITPTVDQPSCNGDSDGSISVVATGGTGTKTYSSNGVDYSAESTWTSLAAGDYTVYVQDNNNCVASTVVTVTEPEVLTSTATSTNILCNAEENATISITAVGGTEPYAYSIDGGTTYTPSPVFTSLMAGDYIVMVADQNGCMFELEAPISITEPDAITASATGTDISCNGDGDGSITVVATGGTEPYTYSTGGAFGSANPITGLDGGSYDVTLLDANGCEFVISTAVVITEPDAIVISNLTPDPIDETPGTNSPYTVAGGNQPYEYSWTNAGGTEVSNTENLPSYTNASDAGTYTLNLTDENGCTATASITITGLNDVNSTYVFNITPNPSTGLFRMNMSGLTGEKMSYDIIDAQGRVVNAVEMGNVAGSRTESIDITNSAAGIYYIMVRIGDSVNSIKLIKQ